MPNWVLSTYIFASEKEENIKDFRNKLLSWTSSKPIMPEAWDGNPCWLGNILWHAGYCGDDSFDCRGVLLDIFELEESSLGGKKIFYFLANTETAWMPMPVMWGAIIDDMYHGEIQFGMISEYDDSAVCYNSEYLKLIGMDIGEKKYWIDGYADSPFELTKNMLNDEREVTAADVSSMFSEILGSKVTEEEIEDEGRREELLEAANEILEERDEDFFLKVLKIEELSLNDFC